jgi:hypothetical protein
MNVLDDDKRAMAALECRLDQALDDLEQCKRERDEARVACAEALAEINAKAADLCAAVKELVWLRTGMMDLLGGAA